MLVEMQTGAVTMENSLVVPQKVKHRVTNPTPKNIPKRIENRSPNKYMYMSVYSSTLHDNPNV